MSEHQVYRIIKNITQAEKVYFKKYAFKRQNKGNDNFKTLFDLLNNAEEYDLKELQLSRKLDDTFRKNMAVSLNQLQSKLVRTLLEYRDSQNTFNLFTAIKEIKLFLDLGLNDMAEKHVLKCIAYTEKYRKSYFTPYLKNKLLSLTRTNIRTENNDLDYQIKDLTNSISKLHLIVDVNAYGYWIEALALENGGLVLKDEKSKKKAKKYIKRGYQLIEHPNMDVYYYGVLISNLLMLQLMVEEFQGFDKLIRIFLIQFGEEVENEIADVHLLDMSIVIKNLMVITLHFGDIDTFNTLYLKMEQLQRKAIAEDAKHNIEVRKHHAHVLHCVLKNEEIDSEIKKTSIDRFQNEEILTATKSEFLVMLLIVLIRKKEYVLAEELGSKFLNEKFNKRVGDELISIKILVGIAWNKLE